MHADKKVLIVEDDIEISELLTIILKKQQLTSVQAYSGTEALLQLQHDTFDLILLDLMLPGASGETLIHEIRKSQDVPIIVISAKVAVEHKVYALKHGADDYITKPSDQEEGMARVEVQ